MYARKFSKEQIRQTALIVDGPAVVFFDISKVNASRDPHVVVKVDAPKSTLITYHRKTPSDIVESKKHRSQP